ncbi:hypothetical protein GCM10010123_05360 [Pilimelia anulata]|uniref:Uncharacterized protein n=1 Tax=Pilimelia anulata TaxID=53371 RepID=A0A8J3B0F5_9ACTN|nr:hypothetical protein [Pilimelia anulata]GGJ78304.1 hypothetical protein GCM10010123_05360 [Pilimelia anulata]
MKPTLYGFLRVPADVSDAAIRELEQQLHDFAHSEGFTLDTIYHEYRNSSYDVLLEMIERMRRAEVHHAAMPILHHISAHPLLQRMYFDLFHQSGLWVYGTAYSPGL